METRVERLVVLQETERESGVSGWKLSKIMTVQNFDPAGKTSCVETNGSLGGGAI